MPRRTGGEVVSVVGGGVNESKGRKKEFEAAECGKSRSKWMWMKWKPWLNSNSKLKPEPASTCTFTRKSHCGMNGKETSMARDRETALT